MNFSTYEEHIRQADQKERRIMIRVLCCAMIVFILTAGAITVAVKNRDINVMETIVRDKTYTPSSSSQAVSISSDGNVIQTSITKSEKYILMTDWKPLTVKESTWVGLREGDLIEVRYSMFGVESVVKIRGGK